MPSTEAPALAAAAAELYGMVSGVQLDNTERAALDVMLAADTDGKWQEPTCKGWFGGAVLEARALAGLFLLDERSIVWSTYLYQSTTEAFRRLRGIIDGSEALRLQVKRVRAARGEEQIVFRGDRRIVFVHRAYDRAGRRGRGWSADCLLLDEANEDLERALPAYTPMTASRPNGQLVINHG